MQRLFTTFAHGWPGFGLLVQRLVAGAVLIHQANALFENATTIAAPTSAGVGTVLAIFIMIGLWTPFAGALVVGFEVWIAFFRPGRSYARNDRTWLMFDRLTALWKKAHCRLKSSALCECLCQKSESPIPLNTDSKT